MVETDLNEKKLSELFDLCKSPVVVEIFKFLTQRKIVEHIQFLNKVTYNERASYALYRFQLYEPKFSPMYYYIDAFRNANLETHQCKQVDFFMKGFTGEILGEFFKTTDLPDGRCLFRTKNKDV